MSSHHLDLSHLSNLVIKNSIISHLPNYPNNNMTNNPSPSPQFLCTHHTWPTIDMKNQIRGSYKVKLHPIHYLSSYFGDDVTMYEQVNNCFILVTTKHTPIWVFICQKPSLCKINFSWNMIKNQCTRESQYLWQCLTLPKVSENHLFLPCYSSIC